MEYIFLECEKLVKRNGGEYGKIKIEVSPLFALGRGLCGDECAYGSLGRGVRESIKNDLSFSIQMDHCRTLCHLGRLYRVDFCQIPEDENKLGLSCLRGPALIYYPYLANDPVFFSSGT
ncbi:hypothetical protein [Paenibacillus jiagnxiensis]|uniref:hypothetical protein n=1 Tax=Paenibacillus jiagnxiensis TaxID=3228926 RepID=UPI0033BF9C3C